LLRDVWFLEKNRRYFSSTTQFLKERTKICLKNQIFSQQGTIMAVDVIYMYVFQRFIFMFQIEVARKAGRNKV
jgi:hypothetical protein